ncbi:MAG TPA: TetR/AcrR family transcriptional regulator [Myxococcales bacterium]|nr:TetR/AcrR family transcriptional regulator [Myxococcales bacterium]HIK84541.1 TetR/AcrR family transcriptional regulator [Myxococcales bacterium]
MKMPIQTDPDSNRDDPGPAARPDASQPETTREAILEAARGRFLRFGPRKTTMDEVARAAGCSRTTLYAHFRNMEDLYGSLLNQDAEAFIRDASNAVASESSTGRKIRRIVEITRATYARNNILRMAFTGDSEMSIERVANVYTRDQEGRIIDLLSSVLEQGIAEGRIRRIDPERVAYLMFHLGTLLVEREVSDAADFEFNEILEVMDDVFASGIRIPRDESR